MSRARSRLCGTQVAPRTAAAAHAALTHPHTEQGGEDDGSSYLSRLPKPGLERHTEG